MPDFTLGLTPTQEEYDTWSPEQRREHQLAAAKLVYGQDVRYKDGKPVENAIPLNRNHLTALQQELDRTKNPRASEIMAENVAIVEANEAAAKAARDAR